PASAVGSNAISGLRALCPGLQAETLAAVAAGLDLGAPRRIVEIPAHRGRHAGGEVVARHPAELARDTGGVDGVTAVVTRAVGDEGLEGGVGRDSARPQRRILRSRPRFFEQAAESVDDLEIGALAVAAEIVLFAG